MDVLLTSVTAISLGGALTASWLTFRRRSRITYSRNIEHLLTVPFRNPLVPVFGPLLPKDSIWQRELKSLEGDGRAGFKCFYSPPGTGLSYSVLSALETRTDVVHCNLAARRSADDLLRALSLAFRYDGKIKSTSPPDINSLVSAFEAAVRRRQARNTLAKKPLILVEDLNTCVDDAGHLLPQARLLARELLGLYERDVASVCYTISDFRGINQLSDATMMADHFPPFPLLDLKEQMTEYLRKSKRVDAREEKEHEEEHGEEARDEGEGASAEHEERDIDAEVAEQLVSTVGAQLGDMSAVIADIESGDSVNSALENLMRHAKARVIDSVTAWNAKGNAEVATEVARCVYDALRDDPHVNWAAVTSHVPYREARRVVESLASQHVLTFSKYPTTVSFTRKALKHAWEQVREEPEMLALFATHRQHQ